MRAFTIGLLAVAGIAIAVPAHAEDAYIGVGPVGVGVGDHDRDRDRDWRHHYARDRHCRVTIVHEDGMTKKIKRCRLSAGLSSYCQCRRSPVGLPPGLLLLFVCLFN